MLFLLDLIQSINLSVISTANEKFKSFSAKEKGKKGVLLDGFKEIPTLKLSYPLKLNLEISRIVFDVVKAANELTFSLSPTIKFMKELEYLFTISYPTLQRFFTLN